MQNNFKTICIQKGLNKQKKNHKEVILIEK
jgi:hypothetical protein